MTITHPTGSEAFAAMLAARPAPWEISLTEAGLIRDAYGQVVLQTDPDHDLPDDVAKGLALSIIIAVNTCAGFKAVD